MKIPVVFVSGLLSNQRLWQHQAEHLGDLATVYCVCPTQGTPSAMVQEILERAPPQFALAGHSMGGWLC